MKSIVHAPEKGLRGLPPVLRLSPGGDGKTLHVTGTNSEVQEIQLVSFYHNLSNIWSPILQGGGNLISVRLPPSPRGVSDSRACSPSWYLWKHPLPSFQLQRHAAGPCLSAGLL